MADYLSSLPVRTSADENVSRIANTSNVAINPATEGTLSSIDTKVATETTLSAVDGKLNSLGQKAMVGSVPVVIASDQTAIPVSFTATAAVAEVSYNTAASVAPSATSTHSYTPVATKQLRKIIISGGARLKAEIQYGASGSETTKAVVFTSAANPVVTVDFPEGISLGSGDTIKIIRTNNDNQAQDLYSTIVLN